MHYQHSAKLWASQRAKALDLHQIAPGNHAVARSKLPPDREAPFAKDPQGDRNKLAKARLRMLSVMLQVNIYYDMCGKKFDKC